MEKIVNRREEIENQIIDLIASGSGRLVVFKPENGQKGVDIVVEKRNRYEPLTAEKVREGFSIYKGRIPINTKLKDKGILFQIISFSGHLKGDNFVAEILDKNVTASENFYLMFVYFNEIKGQINEFIWIVPSLDFKNMAEQGKSLDGEVVLKFQSSLNVNIKNKYSKFLINKKDLSRFLIKAL
jgi:hypothetical protein